jgi:hypothetical protein
MDLFDIYFSGQLLPDQDPEQVRANVARLFRADADKAARLFSGKSIRIKRGVDAETAGQFRARLREVGALVDIKPSKSGRADAAPDAPPIAGIEVSEEPGFELLPAGTGSLADCAPPPPVPPTFAFEGFSLALVGTNLDEQPLEAPAHIATDHLSASPPNSGSLEDCAEEKPALPIPDISHIRIESS